MLLVERHGFAVRHVARAGLQCFGLVDACTAILEILPVEPESFLFLLLLDLHKYHSWADAEMGVPLRSRPRLTGRGLGAPGALSYIASGSTATHAFAPL